MKHMQYLSFASDANGIFKLTEFDGQVITSNAETQPGQSSQESVGVNKPETDGRKC
jgi:hypothetical protein